MLTKLKAHAFFGHFGYKVVMQCKLISYVLVVTNYFLK